MPIIYSQSKHKILVLETRYAVHLQHNIPTSWTSLAKIKMPEMFTIQMYDSYDPSASKISYLEDTTYSKLQSLHVHILTVLIILVILAGVICYHHIPML